MYKFTGYFLYCHIYISSEINMSRLRLIHSTRKSNFSFIHISTGSTEPREVSQIVLHSAISSYTEYCVV